MATTWLASRGPSLLATPPKPLPATYISELPETPAPVRARIANLQNQVSELVRREHAAMRRHKSEVSELEMTLQGLKGKLKESDVWKKKVGITEGEMNRIKNEGDCMRDELNLHSLVQQQKALLAVATEQMQLVEMEHRLVQAEAAKIMRDHKIALFKAKVDDMAADLKEKDAQLAEFEVSLAEANTSLAHQRAAQSKVVKIATSENNELSESKAEIKTLEQKVDGLETKVKGLKEKEKEARAELDNWLREEKGKEGSTDKENRDLQRALKQAKADLATKVEELADLQEELANYKEASKDREKALKAKIRDAASDRDRLVGVEEELEELKVSTKGSSMTESSKVAPTKAVRSQKASAASDDSDSDLANKKTKKNASPQKQSRIKAVAKDVINSDSDSDTAPTAKKSKVKASSTLRNTSEKENTLSKRKSPEPAKMVKSKTIANLQETTQPEKKKKRKLLLPEAHFTWDPIMNSGDGVIPAYLSPVKLAGKTAKGTIPRLGFPSMTSSRSFGRLLSK